MPFSEARACALGEAESLMSHKCEEEAEGQAGRKLAGSHRLADLKCSREEGQQKERKINKTHKRVKDIDSFY